jgi:hypothetical protein
MARSRLNIDHRLLAILALAAAASGVRAQDACGHDHDDDGPEAAAAREAAAVHVEWRASRRPADPARVRLLGINDFHGQVSAGRIVAWRPVGSAGVLAAWLRAAEVGAEDRTLVVHAGDQVGASPPASALLQDEPAISFLNLLANRWCHGLDSEDAPTPGRPGEPDGGPRTLATSATASEARAGRARRVPARAAP